MSKNKNTEFGWARSSLYTIKWVVFMSTYAMLILALLLIEFPRPLGLDWVKVGMLSFLLSIFAILIAIPERIFSLAEKRNNIFDIAICCTLVLNILGFIIGIVAFVVFFFYNLHLIR